MEKLKNLTLACTLLLLIQVDVFAQEGQTDGSYNSETQPDYAVVAPVADEALADEMPIQRPPAEQESASSSKREVQPSSDKPAPEYNSGAIGVSHSQFLANNRRDFSSNLYLLIFLSKSLALVGEIGFSHHQIQSSYVGLNNPQPITYRARSLGIESVFAIDYRLRMSRYFALSLSIGVFYQHHFLEIYDKISDPDFDTSSLTPAAFSRSFGTVFKVGTAITLGRLELPMGYMLRLDTLNFHFSHGFYVGAGLRF